MNLNKERKRSVEEMSISLIPRTLMSFLSVVYKEQDMTTIENLLSPYYMTYGQLQLIMDDIYWPGMTSATAKHPYYYIICKLSKYMQEDTHAKPAQIKKHFIYAVASICHAWYTRKDNSNRFVLHKNPQFVAYEDFGIALPFIWISIDSHGMAHVFQRHKDMPGVQIHLYRTTKRGDLHPLSFFAHVDDEKNQEKAYIEISIYNQSLLNLQTEKASEAKNFVIFVSESLTLSKCMLVSPSTDKVWTIPVIVHLYE